MDQVILQESFEDRSRIVQRLVKGARDKAERSRNAPFRHVKGMKAYALAASRPCGSFPVPPATFVLAARSKLLPD